MNKDDIISTIKGTTFDIAIISGSFSIKKPELGIQIRINTVSAKASNKLISFSNRKIKHEQFMTLTHGIVIPTWNRISFYCRVDDVNEGIEIVKSHIIKQSKIESESLKIQLDAISQIKETNTFVSYVKEK